MEVFRPQVGITLELLPILVPGDERDLFYRETGLEQPARAFVT